MVKRLGTVLASLFRARGGAPIPKHRLECAALINRTHIYMFPRATYRGSAHFAGIAGQILDKAADDEALGQALRQTLTQSRFVTPADPDFGRIFDSTTVTESWEAWLANAKARSGYAGKSGFTRQLHLCNVRLGAELTISPTRHERPFGWGALADEPEITVPADVGDAELGVALRRGFLRCRGYPP